MLPVLELGRDLGEPNRGFRRLDLTKERAEAAELVMAPVLEKAGGLRRDQPLVGIGQGTPGVHVAAHLVDHRGGVVLLLFGRESLALIENEVLLLDGLLPLLRLRDRRDELSAASSFEDFVSGLALSVQLPVPGGRLVGGVQDRMVEEWVGHRFRGPTVRLG